MALQMLGAWAALGVLCAALPAFPRATAAEQMTPLSVAAEGTQFKVTLADGRILRSP